jgi:hypothetical protein
MSQLARASIIQKTLGTRAAAGYMRNKGFTINQAIAHLARKPGKN